MHQSKIPRLRASLKPQCVPTQTIYKKHRSRIPVLRHSSEPQRGPTKARRSMHQSKIPRLRASLKPRYSPTKPICETHRSRIPVQKHPSEPQRGLTKTRRSMHQSRTPGFKKSFEQQHCEKRVGKSMSSHEPDSRLIAATVNSSHEPESKLITATVNTSQKIIDILHSLSDVDFEHTVNGMRENAAATQLLDRETQQVTRMKVKLGTLGAQQRRMLEKFYYNDNPATWGPSPFVILSGLADYRIVFTDKPRDGQPISPPVSPKCMEYSRKFPNRKAY